MNDGAQLAELRARVAQLERENTQLREAPAGAGGEPASRVGRRIRSALAVILVVASVLLAPVAVLGTWARVQLVDTERFTATFAPLAQEATVQELITDQVMVGITDNVDFDGIVEAVFSGLATLDLPDQAEATLPLLQAPAAAGMESMVRTAVGEVVASPQFAQLWSSVLTFSHEQAVTLLQANPDGIIELGSDGALAIQLGPLIEETQELLVAQGFGFAENLPVIEQTIPIVQADSLVLIRSLYEVAVTAGFLLPWVVLVLLLIGVVLAQRKMRALAWGAAGIAVSVGLLGAGLGAGKWFFIGSVSPDIMSAPAATVIFDQATMTLNAVVGALILLSTLVMVGAWFASGAASAVRVRGALDTGFAAIRGALHRAGLTTGSFGTSLERWHQPLVLILTVLALVVVLMIRPVSLGSVLGVLIVLLVLLAVVEILRTPAEADNEDRAPATSSLSP